MYDCIAHAHTFTNPRKPEEVSPWCMEVPHFECMQHENRNVDVLVFYLFSSCMYHSPLEQYLTHKNAVHMFSVGERMNKLSSRSLWPWASCFKYVVLASSHHQTLKPDYKTPQGLHFPPSWDGRLSPKPSAMAIWITAHFRVKDLCQRELMESLCQKELVVEGASCAPPHLLRNTLPLLIWSFCDCSKTAN